MMGIPPGAEAGEPAPTAAETGVPSSAAEPESAVPTSELGTHAEEEEELTLQEWVEAEDELYKEAAEALPRKFDECSFDQGYVRQNIYVCQTCAKDGTSPAGICYSCSISCHTDHDLIELQARRHFRCDCGGHRFPSPCTLQAKDRDAEINPENSYGPNFEDRYCLCGKAYVPESDDMLQCLVCEDWYHDRCLGGIPEQSEYEDFFCRRCTEKHPFLKRYSASAAFFARPVVEAKPDVQAGKRPLDDELGSDPGPSGTAKKPRLLSARSSPRKGDQSGSPQKGEGPRVCTLKQLPDADVGELDLYGTSGWRDALCACKECLDMYYVRDLVFLHEPEELYEPPLDEEATDSPDDLALKQLNRMPRNKAIEAVNVYNQVRDELSEFLREYAKRGRVIKEADVKEFFESRNVALSQKKSTRPVFF